MHLIRTSAELAELCLLPVDPELLTLLGTYAVALEEFGDDLSAAVLIVEATDKLHHVEVTYGQPLVGGGSFLFPVELAAEHAGWIEVVWIHSDDGAGLVLLIENEAQADSNLIAACRRAITDSSPSP